MSREGGTVSSTDWPAYKSKRESLVGRRAQSTEKTQPPRMVVKKERGGVGRDTCVCVCVYGVWQRSKGEVPHQKGTITVSPLAAQCEKKEFQNRQGRK